MGYAFVDLDRIAIDAKTIALIDAELAHKCLVLPLKHVHNTLYLALNDPNDLRAIDAVQLATGCRTIPVFATREALEQALQSYYPRQNGAE